MRARARNVAASARAAAVRHPVTFTVLGLTALILASYLLRSQALWAKFWIDEGLSVGIASHPLGDIPGVLQKDGAPPLYYLLLSIWIDLVGDGEARTHALSLLFALVAIPTAWWSGRRLFGTSSGWASAALVATLPFLTYYAQETRMYSLALLVGLVASGLFAAVFALRDRRLIVPLIIFGALAPYVHNWGLFMLVGCGVAWLGLLWQSEGDTRRALLRDGLIVFGAIALLYVPWLPTLLGQAQSTGAPWADRPNLESIVNILEITVGGGSTGLAIALIGGSGLMRMRKDEQERARAALVLLVVVLTAVVCAWITSQISPAWSGRYVAIVVGPALLLAGAGLVRSGRLGLLTLAVVLPLWWSPQEARIKSRSNVFKVTRTLEERGLVQPGDTVLAVHPEQGPVLRYYLGDRYRWADALGPVEDPLVFDWRDALERLERTGPRSVLRRISPSVQSGRRVVLVLPVIRTSRWNAPWTALVRKRSSQWQRVMDHSGEYRRIAPVPIFGDRRLKKGVRVVVYEKR